MAAQRTKTKPATVQVARASEPSICSKIGEWLNSAAGGWSVLAFYLLVMFLTFGSRYAMWARTDASNAVPAFIAGLIWPIYWVSHFFIALFW